MNTKSTILVVDDTHASLKLLTDILTAEGYFVRPADSGKLALASIAANPPQLILLDILMPEMDGFEVISRLKARPESMNIPVIFLSASFELDQRIEGFNMGAVDFISKPFQREELLARVKTHLELNQLRTRLEQRVAERTEELKQAKEKLVRQERLAAIGQLAASIGHELRNPLGVISNAIYYLNLIIPQASHNVKEYLNIIENETRYSEKIINDLLDFTRIKPTLREPVSVLRLVENTLARFTAPNSVLVSIDIPPELPSIITDQQQMTQVIGNLIVNAYESMADGGNLNIIAHQQQDLIKIQIKDSGLGILPENLRNLFEPLFTTKSKGMGLGLAISKNLIEANHGRIEVQSQPGKGSSFNVYLPVNPPG